MNENESGTIKFRKDRKRYNLDEEMKTKVISPRIPSQLLMVEDLQAIINASEDDAQIVEAAIHEVNEAGQNHYKLDVGASIFERSKFIDCDFEKASFVDVIFHNCDFSNSHFVKAYFNRCEFRNCKCLGTVFNEAVMKHTKMIDSMLKYASLNDAKFEHVEMAHCDMTESSVSETAHKNWNANECLFIGTNFFHTKLKGFDFTSCELENIIISDTLEEIRGVKITAIQALEAARLLGMKVV